MSSPPRKPSAIAEPPSPTDIGADRTLALLYLPKRLRPAFAALWSVDSAMGRVVASTSEPAIGAIRLAWWRERLEDLDHKAGPAEPILQAVHSQLISRGIAGRELAVMEGCWSRLFDPFPWDIRTAEAIFFRGRHLFALAARLLGEASPLAEDAGAIWALVDAARHCSDAASRSRLLDQARSFRGGLPDVAPRALRPLTMLTALALRDAGREETFEREGTPGRAAALLAHRLTGRLPRG